MTTPLPTQGSTNWYAWAQQVDGQARGAAAASSLATVATSGAYNDLSGKPTVQAPLTPTAVKTADYTAAANDLVPVDASGAARTVTLPTAPADRTRVGVKVVAISGTNTVTIACGGSDVLNKTGGSTSATLSLLNQSVTLQYSSALAVWYVLSDDLPLSGLDGRFTKVTVAGAPATSLDIEPATIAQDYGARAADNGLISWAYDIVAAANNTALTAGVVYLVRVTVPAATTITNVVMFVNTAGVTLSNCYVALFDTSGTRLGVSADRSTAWQSSGTKVNPLTSPVSVTAGSYYAAMLANGTTPPTVQRGVSASSVNLSLAAPNLRFAQSGTGQTAIPASITMGSTTGNSNSWWMALS